MAIRRSGLIPRKTIPARRSTETTNDFNEVIGITNQSFNALQCTIQPMIGGSMTPDLIGYADREIYTLYTETMLTEGVEGTNRKPDEVFINGKWFKVIRSKSWSVGIIPHYECVVVEKDEGWV